MSRSPRATELFRATWLEFSELQLWAHLPAELSVRVVLRTGKRRTEHAIALVGSTGPERGLAFYEDPRVFDAMWSGDYLPMKGLSVVDGVLTRIVESEALAPWAEDFVLATASMRLLINLVTGEPTSLSLGRGVKLELKPQTPGKKPR